MLKTKAIVAFSIFSTLFAGAWWFHAEQNRDIPTEVNSPNSEIMLLNTGQLVEQEDRIRVIPRFKPREYIRVIPVEDNR